MKMSFSSTLLHAQKQEVLSVRPSASAYNTNQVTGNKDVSLNGGKKVILDNVYALVDVRIGEDSMNNCTHAIASKLLSLGAKIIKRFTLKMTHLVIHEYNDEWKDKIAKWHHIVQSKRVLNIRIVSPLWVHACITTSSHVDETKYYPLTSGNQQVVAEKQKAMKAKRKRKRPSSSEPVSSMICAEAMISDLKILNYRNKIPQHNDADDMQHFLRLEVEKETERLIREARIQRRKTIAGEFVTRYDTCDNAIPAYSANVVDDCLLRYPEKLDREQAKNQGSVVALKAVTESAKDSGIVHPKDSDESKAPIANTSEAVCKAVPVVTAKSSQPRIVLSFSEIAPELRSLIQKSVEAIDQAYLSEDVNYKKTRIVSHNDVSSPLTHLIAGESSKRTAKVLFALSRDSWIVSDAWVFNSSEKGRWIDEKEYELNTFMSKAERQLQTAVGPMLQNKKFFVGSNVAPSREIIQSLIKCAGGDITNQVQAADLCVCEDGSFRRRIKATGASVVSAKWIFDSIASMSLQDVSLY